MKLTGSLYVYKGNFGYSTLIKNNEDKMYVSVNFRKNNEPTQDKVQIDIKDGFLSMYKDKNGLAKPKLVILEYQDLGVTTTEYTDDFEGDLPF